MRFVLFLLLMVISLAPALAAQDQRTDTVAAPTGAVSLGILVDCSGSQRLQLENTLSAVKQLSELLAESDRAFLVRFVDAGKFSVVQEFTGNKDELIDSADGLYIEGGVTAIVDALDRSIRYATKNESVSGASRVFVLISDGEEQGSAKRVDETVVLLKEKQIKVFAIGISDLRVSTKLLDKLTKETGGRTFTPRTTAELSNAVLTIGKLMRGSPATK